MILYLHQKLMNKNREEFVKVHKQFRHLIRVATVLPNSHSRRLLIPLRGWEKGRLWAP